MKSFLKIIQVSLKGIIYWLRPGVYLSFLSKPLLLIANTLNISKWVAEQKDKSIMNDFFTWKRDHNRRYNLYENISQKMQLSDLDVDYIELGVYKGQSFKWWLNNNSNPNSKFYGFDTFEGLPEAWGLNFKKGSMNAVDIPDITDERASFIKGLFQDTLPTFLKENNLDNGKRKIIHFDADLFSSTLFGLCTLSPFFKEGDIILFDEFNVPNSEYYALKIFEETYYRKFKLIGSVNNYYQIAMVVVK